MIVYPTILGDDPGFSEQFQSIQSVACNNGLLSDTGVTLKNGKGIFDGITGEIIYGDDSRAQQDLNNFTVACRIKISSSSSTGFIANKRIGFSTSNVGWMMYIDASGRFRTEISDGITEKTGPMELILETIPGTRWL